MRKTPFRSLFLLPLSAFLLPCGILFPRSGWAAGFSYVRPFGPNAPWNVPLSKILVLPEAQSRKYAAMFWNKGCTGRPGNVNVNGFSPKDLYTYPVYYVHGPKGDGVEGATLRVPVQVRHADWGSNLIGATVPWNPKWRPCGQWKADGTGEERDIDGQVILLDPTTGGEWDLWQVVFDGKVLSVGNGNQVPGDYRVKEDSFAKSRGVGIPYLAMLVTQEEVGAGKIEHALSVPNYYNDRKKFNCPAAKTDGAGFSSDTSDDGIPEGMRFGVPSLTEERIEKWVAAFPPEVPESQKKLARTLARALRDYGWISTDHSGGAHVQFEAPQSALKAWKRMGLLSLEASNGKSYPRDLLDGLFTDKDIQVYAPCPYGRQ